MAKSNGSKRKLQKRKNENSLINNVQILAIKRNALESVLMRQMNLEPIIQGEVSQKEKNKYHMLTYIYEIQKDGTDRQGGHGDTNIENRLVDTEREGEGGTN